MKIGFLGLGRMGEAIAATLMAAGHELVLWNRSPGKADPLVAAGAAVALHVQEAADADIVISMLADDAALEAVTLGDGGILTGRAPVHISLSTVSVALADRLDAEHSARGKVLISAPVFGRPAVARAGALTIVAAGQPQAIDLCRPIFAAIGRKTLVVGERPSIANLLKLCGNFMVASTLETLGEAITLAQRGGVAAHDLIEIVTGTLFPGPVHETYGRIMIERAFSPPGFAAPLGLKDVELVAAAARVLQVPMPLLGVVRGHLLSLIAQEGSDIDWAAILLPIERAAGVDSVGAVGNR